MPLLQRFQTNRPYPAFVPSPTEGASPSPPPCPRPRARGVMAIASGKPCSGVVLAAVSLERSDVVPGLARTRLFPRDLPGQWTVVAIATGGGDRGGETPSPDKMTPKSPSPAPPPRPRFLERILVRPSPAPPPRPAFGLLPRPRPGARAVFAIASGKPRPGSGVDAGFPKDRERTGRGEPARNWFFPGPLPLDSGPW